MKLEVGRVYVLINSEDAFSISEITDKPRVVKLVRVVRSLLTDKVFMAVVGIEEHDGLPLVQHVFEYQLKPASEKQRVAFNREYFETLNRFKEEGRSAYWL